MINDRYRNSFSHFRLLALHFTSLHVEQSFIIEVWDCGRISTVDKDLLVYSCLELAVGGGSSSWNVRFVCRFNDWKLESVRSFFDILYSNIPSRGVHDHLRGNGKFDVKSYYEVIHGSNDVRFP